MFPDGSNEGLYHTADATLWFFHAVDRYLEATGDSAILTALMPTLADIVARHAEQCRHAFNERFWYPEGGYLYDVVESPELAGGDDPACRPNQLLAISLTHSVLEPARRASVVETARARLLTPVGLRSLSPDRPDFKPTYHGDLRTRDSAYHQGTMWAWLIGPFIDAWLKVHPEDRRRARRFLDGFVPHLDEACVGTISEVFDAVEPYTPRGCVAQAWSVAEVLRSWVRTASSPAPPSNPL